MAVRMLNLTGGGIGDGINPGSSGSSDMMERVKEMSPCSRGVLARTVQILVWIGGVQMSLGINAGMMGSMMSGGAGVGTPFGSGAAAVRRPRGDEDSEQQQHRQQQQQHPHQQQHQQQQQQQRQLIPASQVQYNDMQMKELEALFSNSSGGGGGGGMGNMIGVI